MTPQAHVVGWGKYVPQHVLTNDDLTQMVETSDEWIRTRTGISERHIASDDETTAALAIEAAHEAMEMAGIKPSELDLIIVATATPDYSFPSTACLVQDALGATRAAAFDMSAGCSGFVYGVSVAADLVASGAHHTVLVIGAETLSRIIDWQDRTTCVLFGDGAGAVILQGNGANGGILSSVLGSDGSGSDLLRVPAGGSRLPASHHTVSEGLHFLKMKGREVFRFAVRVMPAATRQVLEMADLALEDVSLIIPHQANRRITDASIRTLGLPDDRIYSNVERYGNTSAASIPIALCEAVEEGRLQRDDLVVLVGFGAGLTWAATAIRWSAPMPSMLPTRWERTWYGVRYRYAAVRSLVRRIIRWLAARIFRDE
jgi:3-oxoacyl-[acyl-carrier-protein] synthase-3